MPVYNRETLKANRLPWVDIDDFKFHVLARQFARPPEQLQAHSDGKSPIWAHPAAVEEPTTMEFKKQFQKERLMVITGEVSVESELGRVTLKRRDWIDIPDGGARVVNTLNGSSEFLWLAGHWQQAIRMEIFRFYPERPLDYHFHDGDEYWFVHRGHFTLQYADREYPMGPGGMLAAGMGYEHGAQAPEELFEGVALATQLEGTGRDGHLLREVHGDPVPGREVPAEAWKGQWR